MRPGIFEEYFRLASSILLPGNVRRIISSICSLTGRHILVPVAPHPDDIGVSEEDYVANLHEYVFPVDGILLRRRAREWLVDPNGRACIVSRKCSSSRGHPDSCEHRMSCETPASELERLLPTCTQPRSLHHPVLVLRRGAYVEGLGLV